MSLLTTSVIQTEFGAVRVADQPGVDDGPPLVFVHGYPDNLQIWSRVFAELGSSSRRAVAFDWPGLGHSDPHVGGATPFHLGRHFVSVLDALGIERCVPVGFDMGAHAVVAAATSAPERIDKLVLTNFLADGEVETSWDIDVMRRLGLNRVILKWAPRVVFERAKRTFLVSSSLTRDVADDLWSGFSNDERLGHLRRMCAGYQAALPRVTRLLPDIDAETLIMWADDDPHFPVAQGRAVEAAVAANRMHVMEGAPHWFMWERADEVVTLLRSFLESD